MSNPLDSLKTSFKVSNSKDFVGEPEGDDADDESNTEMNIVVKKRGRKSKINIVDSNCEAIEIVPKKRGRKPKNPDAVKEPIVKEKKKRGRKPKIVDPNNIPDVPRVRKRGRRPKCPVKSISEIREKFKNTGDLVKFPPTSEIINENHSKTHVPFGNLNIILHKPPEIDTSELRKFYNTSKETKVTTDIIDQGYHSPILSESESEVEKRPYNNNCNCNCKQEIPGIEYVKSEKKKVNKQLYKFSNRLDECGKWAEKSNVLCWWCCHSFTTMPIPSVVTYDERRKRYHLKGIFCSWECSNSFTSENCRNFSYFYKLFREWTGDKSTTNIKKAPSKYILKAFGGHMDISEFRKCPYESREIFLSENNKMSYVNQDILEVYIEMEKKKKKKLTLIRKKPLRNTTETLFENASFEN